VNPAVHPPTHTHLRTLLPPKHQTSFTSFR
jgi:hypothetical protein